MLYWLLDDLLNRNSDVVFPVVCREVRSINNMLYGFLDNSLDWPPDNFLNVFLNKVLLMIPMEDWPRDEAFNLLVVNFSWKNVCISIFMKICDITVNMSVVID